MFQQKSHFCVVCKIIPAAVPLTTEQCENSLSPDDIEVCCSRPGIYAGQMCRNVGTKKRVWWVGRRRGGNISPACRGGSSESKDDNNVHDVIFAGLFLVQK